MKKLFVCIAFICCIFGFSGCVDSAPKCDDKDVLIVLKKIIRDGLVSVGISKKEVEKVVISIDTFMLDETDNEAKKSICKARAILSKNGKKELEEYIRYSAQYTQDDKHVYVELFDE